LHYHAPHERPEILDALRARATDRQIHQHGPDYDFRRRGGNGLIRRSVRAGRLGNRELRG
jgi:hypothetical protein